MNVQNKSIERESKPAASIEVELLQSVYLNWSASGIGFGQLYFYQDKNGIIRCDNEMMSKDFIKLALCALVDQAVLADEPRSGSRREESNVDG